MVFQVYSQITYNQNKRKNRNMNAENKLTKCKINKRYKLRNKRTWEVIILTINRLIKDVE